MPPNHAPRTLLRHRLIGPSLMQVGQCAHAFMRSLRIRRECWRLLVFLSSSVLLAGAGLPARAGGLTLEQAINVAVQGNKDLQAARYAAAQARARLQQAGLPPNPRLDIAARNAPIFRNGDGYTASIGLSQQFPVAGRIARQKDVARVDVALAVAEIRQAELKLAGDVAAGFYRLQALNRQIETRERLIDVDRKLVAATRGRFKAAEVSELDVNAAQLDLQRLSQERALLHSQRATQLAQLNQLLGRAAAQPLELDDAPPRADALPSLAEQQREALALRPDLRFAQLNAERARADQALARAQRWEDWTVGAGLVQDRLAIDGGPLQGTSRTIGLSLSIPLPLLNGNQGRIAEAAAAADQASARIEALKLGIGNEVASAYAEAERLREVIAQYQRSMLPVSERNVRLAQQGYGQGLVSIVEVVQAQRQQGELNVAYLNTLDQYLQAWSRLRTASGAYLEYLEQSDR